MNRLKKYLCFYLDVPSLVFIVLIILLLNQILHFCITNNIIHGFFLNVLSSILAAIILSGIIWATFKINYKSQVSGEYKASVLKNGVKEDWGIVTLRWNLLRNLFRAHLESKNKILIGYALLIKGSHLIGYYYESGNLLRRRFGTFLYTLDGSGKKFQGKILCFDPENNTYNKPEVEDVEWEQQ